MTKKFIIAVGIIVVVTILALGQYIILKIADMGVVRWAGKKEEVQMANLENEVVHAELAGRYYAIPMRYFYTEGKVKRGVWPVAKEERVKVDYLSLSLLLPDLRPYYPEDDARWKNRGDGDVVEVSISEPAGGGGTWTPGASLPPSNRKIGEKWPKEILFFINTSLAVFDQAQEKPLYNKDFEIAFGVHLEEKTSGYSYGGRYQEKYRIKGWALSEDLTEKLDHYPLYTKIQFSDNNYGIKAVFPINIEKYCINPYDYAVYTGFYYKPVMPDPDIRLPFSPTSMDYYKPEYNWRMFDRIGMEYQGGNGVIHITNGCISEFDFIVTKKSD